MAGNPSATSITVAETLQRLDGEFSAVTQTIEAGGFALWVGAGISRIAPSLDDIVARALESLRASANSPNADPSFEAALKEALAMTSVAWAEVVPNLSKTFDTWPQATTIKEELRKKYSDLLDIRVGTLPDDYMLWSAVDVRAAFADPPPPACEHLCIALLVIEGAVAEISSANWDGFIEAAVDRLSNGAVGMLQVVVDPNHLRDAAGRARLLKFHGCVVHATQNPELYRSFLIGAATQITLWQTEATYKAIRSEVVGLATRDKALMVGLSLQDPNLQWVFGEARAALKWPWPCAPAAQAHVFCEDEIGAKQRAMLKVVYGDAYTPNSAAIEEGALLRSWPEQVLLSLAIKLLCDKLEMLAGKVLVGTSLASSQSEIKASLTALRDVVGGAADGDRTAFTNRAIALWSRAVRLFRNGELPLSPDGYEAISMTGMGQLAGDANALASGFGEAAIGLALVGGGQTSGEWSATVPTSADLTQGALQVTGAWEGARATSVFFVRGAAEAIALGKQGAFANDNVVVVHSDNAWAEMQRASAKTKPRRRPTRPPGRTGLPSVRHLSIRELVDTAATLAALNTKFRERAGF